MHLDTNTNGECLWWTKCSFSHTYQVSAGDERAPETGEPSSFSLTASEIFYAILINVFQCL
jgi:hypothetical protein